MPKYSNYGKFRIPKVGTPKDGRTTNHSRIVRFVPDHRCKCCEEFFLTPTLADGWWKVKCPDGNTARIRNHNLLDWMDVVDAHHDLFR